nr:hypothetical protein CFP56_18336 [Quercus suber]
MNKTIKCGKCKKEGHNARRCKASITGETLWQRRDRLGPAVNLQKQSRLQHFKLHLSHQPSASMSTSGVPSEGSGGGAARGFKGKKFQPVGGKGKNAAGKGTKSSK